MTSLFVTDIHLNLRNNRDWEQSRLLQLFDSIAKDPCEFVILGGDIFDLPKPSLDEINTFYQAIAKLSDKKEVILISGNHENLSDTKTVFDYLPKVGFRYIETGFLRVPGYDLYFSSHIKCKEISNVKKDLSSTRINILFSHFRANYGTFIKGEIDVKEVSDLFDYVFVGDIHHLYSPYHNVFYPSSPYGVHFEPSRDYGWYKLNFDKEFSYVWERLHLPSKILVEATQEEILNGLSLDDKHKYKVIVKGEPNTKVSNLLVKDPKVSTFDYKPQEISTTEEFDQLLEDLSSHVDEDIVDTIFKLVKATDYVLKKDDEQYLRGLLLNARN